MSIFMHFPAKWRMLNLKIAEVDWEICSMVPPIHPYHLMIFSLGGCMHTKSDWQQQRQRVSGTSSVPRSGPSLLSCRLLLSFLSSCPPRRDRWLTTLTIAGAAAPCSAEHKPHDKLPSSVCFANRPHRSPPRPVVTFCCILYMQIPANQLARRSLHCPLWLKWIDCGPKSTPARLPRTHDSTGCNRSKWKGINLEEMFLHSFPQFPSLHTLSPPHNCRHKTHRNLLKERKWQCKQSE